MNGDQPERSVLFVCVENACRSQMAEALFNHLAPPGWRAISAGTKPAARVNPNVVLVMKELGIDVSDRIPKLLTQEMVAQADRIITMGCGADICPAPYLPKIEDWGIEDPSGKPIERFREIRDEIRERVEHLILELAEG